MKKYECVQLDHHNDVPEVIEAFIDEGWVLHTYQAVGVSMTSNVKHYLLFEIDDDDDKSDLSNPTIAEAIKRGGEIG